jgi:hypothetical protein
VRASSSSCRSFAAEHEVAQHAAKGFGEIGRCEGGFGRTVASTVPLIRTTRSQNSGTEPRLWVETSMIRPSSRSSFISSMICFLGLHVDAGERFVEQDHLAVLGQRAGEEDALALTA